VLIRPIEAMLRSEQSFYLLIPTDQPLSPQARAFRDWILVEAKERTA
jgi:DNA-binding transcriptional LysR family regulator